MALIPPLNGPPTSSKPDDPRNSSLQQRVQNVATSIFTSCAHEHPPERSIHIQVDPILQALDPNDPLWPVIRLVQKDGLQLATLSKEMRSNPIVVKAAVENNGLALQFAEDLLAENPDIVLAAIHNNPRAILYVPSWLYSIKNRELIAFIQGLGYESNSRGICCGLGLMGILAILCEDFDTYELRLKKMAILIHKYKQISNRDTFLEVVKKNALALQKDVDLIAFCDGIELCQKATDYPHLFKDPLCEAIHKNFLNSVVPMIGSAKLQKSGGVNMLGHFLRIYDTEELALHFEKLVPLFQPGTPCVIGLNGRDHALIIIYDIENSSWTLIEHGHIYRSMNESALAAHVHHSLIPGFEHGRTADLCAITTSIFTTKDKSASLQKILERNCPDLLDISELSDEKKQFANNPLLLLEMIYNDDLAMFKAVLAHVKIFSNEAKLPTHFWSILMTALKDTTPDFSTLIIEKLGSTAIDKKDAGEMTFLLAAVKANAIPLVKLLLAAGANPNQVDRHGKTPLEIALEKNYPELAKLFSPRSKL